MIFMVNLYKRKIKSKLLYLFSCQNPTRCLWPWKPMKSHKKGHSSLLVSDRSTCSCINSHNRRKWIRQLAVMMALLKLCLPLSTLAYLGWLWSLQTTCSFRRTLFSLCESSPLGLSTHIWLPHGSLAKIISLELDT